MKKTMIVSAALIAGGNLFGAIRAVTPDMYGGNTNAWQVKRHNEKMNVVTNGGSKVVFIGDSITHFWESNGKAQWNRYFAGEPYNALDLGISGDRTEHVLWRITEGKELDGYEAKCILLMIGTNNIGHRGFEGETVADTILGIREILKTIRAKQPTAKVVLTAIFPRSAKATNRYRHHNDLVNREICRFADGKDIFWVDFNDQFLSADGTLSVEVFPDLLHPGDYGYEVWAAAVKPYIDYALSDGKLPPPPNRYASMARAEIFSSATLVTTCPASRIRLETEWWAERLLRNRNQIAESNTAEQSETAEGREIDLVFFGDSITHHWDTDGKDSLAELRKTYSVLNLGYGGDRTENLLWRGENGELDGYKAKCVMLMIGTNNTWHRNDKPKKIAEGIRAILDLVAKKQPQAKVLLLPIFPFGDSPEHNNRVNNEAVNAIIKEYADGEKVVWVDFNAKFLDEKGDTIKFMPDRCHPNAEAYRDIWLPAVLPYFQKICGR